MPDYDAFGRAIGEDPLKDLREAANAVPPREAPRVEVSMGAPAPAAPTPETEAFGGPREPEPAAATPEPEHVFVPPPEFVRPRRRRRGFAGLFVVVAVIGVVGVMTNSAVEKGSDLIDRITPALPDAEPDAAPAPAGLEAGSLIRQANFAAAIKTLADSGLGRPTYLRIAPDRIDAQLLEGSTLHVVQITPDGELREFASSQGSGRPIAFKAIDPAAPERLVRRGATRKSPPRNINYLVISSGPPQSVGAYFKSGRTVIGDAHGRPQRVI